MKNISRLLAASAVILFLMPAFSFAQGFYAGIGADTQSVDFNEKLVIKQTPQ